MSVKFYLTGTIEDEVMICNSFKCFHSVSYFEELIKRTFDLRQTVNEPIQVLFQIFNTVNQPWMKIPFISTLIKLCSKVTSVGS